MLSNLHISEAFRLMMRAKAYLVYRAAVYGVVGACMIVGLIILALIGKIFGSVAAIVLFIIAAAGCGWGLRLLREYVLYVLQAGYLALLVEHADGGELPPGTDQTVWAKARVMHYFKEVSALSLIDQFVKGIIGALNRTLFNVMTILPIPGLDGVAKVAQKVVDYSLTYVDEAMIAYTFRTKNENVFEAATHGILLYCQAWKGLLKNAVALTLLGYVFAVAAAGVFLVPLAILAMITPHGWVIFHYFLFGLAMVLGVACKWIFFDPLACTATVLTFLRETEGLTPDAAWEERIASVSSKFSELKAKAQAKMGEPVHTPAPQEAVAQ